MTELGLGVAPLEREQTGRTDPDAVDATLAASGDGSAFERLYRGHVSRVYALVRRMLNDDDADEVAQDIFVRAWQKLGTFRGEAAFGTWLHRLAVNVILARRETLGTRRKRYLEGDDVLEMVPAPDKVVVAGNALTVRPAPTSQAAGRSLPNAAARRARRSPSTPKPPANMTSIKAQELPRQSNP